MTNQNVLMNDHKKSHTKFKVKSFTSNRCAPQTSCGSEPNFSDKEIGLGWNEMSYIRKMLEYTKAKSHL